jgi:uncharacterized protein (TIGR03437 family)
MRAIGPRARVFVAIFAAALSACALNDDQPPPQIGAIVPGQAAAGAMVTIEGDHFCAAVDRGGEEPASCDGAGGLVAFGGASALSLRWTDQAVDVEVPAVAAGPVTVTVVVAGRRSNGSGFTITP